MRNNLQLIKEYRKSTKGKQGKIKKKKKKDQKNKEENLKEKGKDILTQSL